MCAWRADGQKSSCARMYFCDAMVRRSRHGARCRIATAIIMRGGGLTHNTTTAPPEMRISCYARAGRDEERAGGGGRATGEQSQHWQISWVGAADVSTPVHPDRGPKRALFFVPHHPLIFHHSVTPHIGVDVVASLCACQLEWAWPSYWSNPS
jgi:hypothetical protein